MSDKYYKVSELTPLKSSSWAPVRAGILKMSGAFEKSEFFLNIAKLAFEY